MALAVNTVATGGLPVVDVTATLPKMGMPVSEAAAGKGVAVTKVANLGVPVTFDVVGGGSSPTWTPADLGADLWAWWKFDAMPEAGTVAVASVADSSGNGRTLTLVGLPTAKANGQNSLKTLNFAGTQPKYGTFASVQTFTAGSFFAVNKGTTGDMGGVCDMGFYTQVNHYTFSGQVLSDFITDTRKSAGTVAVNVWHQVLFWSAASDWGHAMDGTDKFTTTSNFPAGAATCYLAGDANTAWTHQGEFGEVVILVNKPTTLNRQKLEGYLAHKWGIQASLPAGHPYKAAPPPPA